MTLLQPLVALAGLLLITPPAAVATPQSGGKLVVKVGKILPGPGLAPIENGVIYIENGRIKAIGTDVDAAWDARVVEQPEMVAFPGFVEAITNRGMDRANENVDIAPFLNVRDSIDPVNFYFEDSLRWGVTTINVQQGDQCVVGAQGLVVKPHGMTVEKMLVKNNAGVVLASGPKRGFSSATQAQALRGAFGDLRRYLEDIVQQKKDGDDKARREALFQGRDLEGENAKGREMGGTAWKVAGLEGVPRGEIDEKQEPLLALVEGRLPAFFYCDRPMDVHRALEIARDNGFLARTTLVLGSGCWKAADVIAEAGVPVVLSSNLVHVERDVITGEETETFEAAEFAAKGVRFAFNSQNASTQSLWYQAAMAIGLGLSREQALAAVTTVPAEILGLGKRLGSLEVGKDGNVLLFSGDPLSVTSFVERVVIEGDLVYDRSTDVRVKHLLEGVNPPGTAAMGEVPGEEHIHDGEEPEPVDKKKKDPGEGDDKEQDQ